MEFGHRMVKEKPKVDFIVQTSLKECNGFRQMHEKKTLLRDLFQKKLSLHLFGATNVWTQNGNPETRTPNGYFDPE